MFVVMPVEIFHVMIVILTGFIQNHPKITAVNTCLFYPADFCSKAFCRDAFQYFLKHFGICPQIEQSRYGHISADTSVTFQIKRSTLYFTHLSCLLYRFLSTTPEIYRLVVLKRCKKTSFGKLFLNDIQGFFVFCQNRMIMVSGSNIF